MQIKVLLSKSSDPLIVSVISSSNSNACPNLSDLKATASKLKAFKFLSIHRQGYKPFSSTDSSSSSKSKGKVSLLENAVELSETEIYVLKDLGPQISYKLVFLVEYAGPIFIMMLYALYFHYPTKASGISVFKSMQPVARLGVIMWLIHFLKREMETLVVHKFSRPTMPLFNLFKNCSYYWSFAMMVGYPLCHPSYTPPTSEIQLAIGAAIWGMSELGNLYVHVLLSSLRRKSGSTNRPIPTGWPFVLVSCPNYTFEVLSWVGFSIFTQIAFAYIFTLVGLLQMTSWAVKKHVGYVKTYGKEYKQLKRKAIIPFLV